MGESFLVLTRFRAQVFCEETLLLQADASVKKTMDRREKKLQMGVSEGNLPWLLKLENIAR